MRVSILDESRLQRLALQMTLGGALGGLVSYGAWIAAPVTASEGVLAAACAAAGAVVQGAALRGWRAASSFVLLSGLWAAGLWWMGGSAPSLGALLLAASGGVIVARGSRGARWAGVALLSGLGLLVGPYVAWSLAGSELAAWFPLWSAGVFAGAALGLIAGAARLLAGLSWGEPVRRAREDELAQRLHGELRQHWETLAEQRRALEARLAPEKKARRALEALSWELLAAGQRWPTLDPARAEALAAEASRLGARAADETDETARAELEAAAATLRAEEEQARPLLVRYRQASARALRVASALGPLGLACDLHGEGSPLIVSRLTALRQLLS